MKNNLLLLVTLASGLTTQAVHAAVANANKKEITTDALVKEQTNARNVALRNGIMSSVQTFVCDFTLKAIQDILAEILPYLKNPDLLDSLPPEQEIQMLAKIILATTLRLGIIVGISNITNQISDSIKHCYLRHLAQNSSTTPDETKKRIQTLDKRWDNTWYGIKHGALGALFLNMIRENPDRNTSKIIYGAIAAGFILSATNHTGIALGTFVPENE